MTFKRVHVLGTVDPFKRHVRVLEWRCTVKYYDPSTKWEHDMEYQTIAAELQKKAQEMGLRDLPWPRPKGFMGAKGSSALKFSELKAAKELEEIARKKRLEWRNLKKDWSPANYPEGTFLVVVGELLDSVVRQCYTLESAVDTAKKKYEIDKCVEVLEVTGEDSYIVHESWKVGDGRIPL